ncbi:hypothetical protein J6590_034990 [Homalodisca vitripennis]|nr:hypothetical protein J6590_034990 [Homalodisca vitripennis]
MKFTKSSLVEKNSLMNDIFQGYVSEAAVRLGCHWLTDGSRNCHLISGLSCSQSILFNQLHTPHSLLHTHLASTPMSCKHTI